MTTRPTSHPPVRAFRFGRNWERYVSKHLTPERERIATRSLQDLLSIPLDGKSFLDIGSGSGLFSLAAHRLGAAPLVSVDVDPESVESTGRLRESVGRPSTWRVVAGSILDDELVTGLAPADIVYSWGVLHHTGDMIAAIRNAARLVRPGGLFCIAIYNDPTGGVLTSSRWLQVKRLYNRLPRVLQVVAELAFEAAWVAYELRRGRNPVRAAREYKRSRGMARRIDLIDWLGGYPYEFAKPEAIIRLCEEKCGMRTLKVLRVPCSGTGNNQFVFERVA